MFILLSLSLSICVPLVLSQVIVVMVGGAVKAWAKYRLPGVTLEFSSFHPLLQHPRSGQEVAAGQQQIK
jgi:hypothetical protein